MRLRITIDVFSGRENPVIELIGKEAQDAFERLRPVRKLEMEEKKPLPTATLGYRGMVIEQLGEPEKGLPGIFRLAHGDLIGRRLAHRAADKAFEDFIFSKTGPIQKLEWEDKQINTLYQEINRLKVIRESWPGKIISKGPISDPPCKTAPAYNPDWWNVPPIQGNNNCYNYGCNIRTDTFAQPGRAAGAMYTALTCASVRPAAIADGLINTPQADNKCPPKGHLVALVIWPGEDYHWLRKGSNGKWSHKPGGTAATNLDNSGKEIQDVRTANRGPYTEFCTFMEVHSDKVKIN
jgi:hypothetical protein